MFYMRCDEEYQSQLLRAMVRDMTRNDPALTHDGTWYVEVTLSADPAIDDDDGDVIKGLLLGVVELDNTEWIVIAPRTDDDTDPGRRQQVPPVLVNPDEVTDFLIP